MGSTSSKNSSSSEPNNQKKSQIVTKSIQSQSNTKKSLNEKEINPLASPTVASSVLQNCSVPSKSNQIEIQKLLNNICKTWQNVKSNQLVQEVSKKKKQFGEYVCKPMNQIYMEIPRQLTNFKFEYINRYDYKQRLLCLGLTSAIVGILAFRRTQLLNLPAATFKSLKDTAVVYFGLGLIIAPEIYNPLMSQI